MQVTLKSQFSPHWDRMEEKPLIKNIPKLLRSLGPRYCTGDLYVWVNFQTGLIVLILTRYYSNKKMHYFYPHLKGKRDAQPMVSVTMQTAHEKPHWETNMTRTIFNVF